jgi:hypothetical protein
MATKRAESPHRKRRFRVGSLDTIAKIAQFERRLLKLAMKSAVGAGGEISVNDIYKLSSVCSQLVKTVEVSDLEARLTALEKKTGQR